MNIVVSRYDLYPISPAPTCVVVGFRVTHNECSMYKESIVTLEDANGKSQIEVAQLAWAAVVTEIEAWCQQCCIQTIVGKPFVPFVAVEEEQPVVEEEQPVVEPVVIEEGQGP